MGIDPRYNESLAFLQKWQIDGPWVLTAISLDKKAITTETFQDATKVVEWLQKYGADRNIYFSVNPVRHSISKKPTRGDVASLSWLHVDIDPRAGESLGTERERILNLLRNPPNDIPKPTAIIFSGGGYQGFWKLEQPMDIHGEVALYEEAKLFNLSLELAFGADSCHNVDRIMRLPGTINRPDKNKQAKGRTDTLAELIEWDDNAIYNIGNFTQAQPPKSITDNPAIVVNLNNVKRIKDINSLGDKVSDLCKVVVVQAHDPDNLDRFGSRSEALFFVCCELARAEVPTETIYSVITDPEFRISESVLDKGANAESYAVRQIERATEASQTLDKDDKGRVYPTIQNVRRIIAKMGVQLSYDEFADRSMIHGLEEKGFPPVIQDEVINYLWLRAEEHYRLGMGKDKFCDIVMDMARKSIHNPVQEYLANLTWDNVPRIDTWLTRYLGAPDNIFTRAVGRIVLVAAVRRARQPGCKFDEMLILEGEQGTGKSLALKILAVRDDWFTEDLILNADTKKQIEQISGKWIVEAGELKGIKNRQTEFLKSFLSRQIDGARMSYARLRKEYPRRCIIIGTTNDHSYLQDNTGNRRFWPVATNNIDLRTLRADRDLLWAEAAHAEASGESIRLNPKLYPVAAEEQEERREVDPWASELENMIGDQQGKISRRTIWGWLGYEKSYTIKQEDGTHLSSAMRDLGFQRVKRMRFGNDQPEVGYWRGNKDRIITPFEPTSL